MADLLEQGYSACEKVNVVCDNLNTHTMGAFYEVFEPERARSMVTSLSRLSVVIGARDELIILGRPRL